MNGQVLAAVALVVWVPLVIRQFLRYFQKRHPGRLAIFSAFFFIAFICTTAFWVDGLKLPDLQAVRSYIYGAAIVVAAHFYLSLWLARAAERKLAAQRNGSTSGDYP